MKAFLLWGVCILSYVAAAPANDAGKTTDLKSLQVSFVAMSTALSNLDTALTSLTGDSTSAQALGPAIQGVLNSLTQANTDLASVQQLSISDSIVFQESAETLAKSVKIMVMSAMLQRSTFEQLSMAPVMLQGFKSIDSLAGPYSQAVLSRVPAESLSLTSSTLGSAAGSVGMGIVLFSIPALQMPLSSGGAAPTAPQTTPPQVATLPPSNSTTTRRNSASTYLYKRRR